MADWADLWKGTIFGHPEDIEVEKDEICPMCHNTGFVDAYPGKMIFGADPCDCGIGWE